MDRILEPEIMDGEEQCRAYAEADFSAPNTRFLELMGAAFGGGRIRGRVLDLGCGDGDILFRLAAIWPECDITGIDASAAMLRHAEHRLAATPHLGGRLRFVRAFLPDLQLQPRSQDVVTSNSLLHHLPEPRLFWDTVKRFGRPGATVCVMDLVRPESAERAGEIVALHAAGAPAVLRRDFHNSLLAAFRVEEVREQLVSAGLGHFSLERASDRHWVAWGEVP